MSQIIYGFHAIANRAKQHSDSILYVYLNQARQDKRMQQLIDILKSKQIKYEFCPIKELDILANNNSHQGVIAKVEKIELENNLDTILDNLEQTNQKANFLILDGITDPHNLGACFRVADATGVNAIIAPKDNSVNINATVAKVASGAIETIPYITVTNLGRTITYLKQRGIWTIGTSDKNSLDIYDKSIDLNTSIAWVMGSEGNGMRKGIMQKCDFLVSIPMLGSISSLNISVASAICLYETLRQRKSKA